MGVREEKDMNQRGEGQQTVEGLLVHSKQFGFHCANGRFEERSKLKGSPWLLL
jgi:hypothetical protein